jgi:hypothetical protein
MKLKAFFEKPSKAPSPRPSLGELFKDKRFIVYVVLFAVAAVCMLSWVSAGNFFHYQLLWLELISCAATILFAVCAWYFLGFIRIRSIRRRVRIGLVVFMGVMLFSMGMRLYFSYLRFLF